MSGQALSGQSLNGCTIGHLEVLDRETRPVCTLRAGEPATVRFDVEISEEIVFDPTFRVSVVNVSTGITIYSRHIAEDGWDISWLPRGRYRVEYHVPRLAFVAGRYRVSVESAVVPNGAYHPLACPPSGADLDVVGETDGDGAGIAGSWQLAGHDGTRGVENLSWRKGKDDWFWKHFDHAARVVIHYMLDDSPLLRGKILDIGCGEGVTDLGVFLRKRPELLVGLDVEGNFRELPRIMRENGLPTDVIPERLVFQRQDVNKISYPDDHFDVVLSWASLEHFAGGYLQALREVKRVLKDGGLFFLHPGLYFCSFGHHLSEFDSEPFVHLKRSREELKNIVFTAAPRFMDRVGLAYSRADFWRYYNELNKITVTQLESELRGLGFEFKKVAVRAEDLVTYTPQLQKYSIQDLTTQEVYMTVVNRKPARTRDGVHAPSAHVAARDGRFDYAEYEFGLRDRQWSRELLAGCVPFFAGCRKVLDLACGSGVFLELLAESGIPAIGVERNERTARWVRAQGWDVVHRDVFEFLAESGDTYDGVFCSHFLEHLPFEDVLRLMELTVSRLEPGGTAVWVFPNPESIRMQLFGFWRDPEHVRFYHPELIEAVCGHYGLTVHHTNRGQEPFAVPLPAGAVAPASNPLHAHATRRTRLRQRMADGYVKLLRGLRVVPKADLVALEARLPRDGALLPWAEKAGWALNRMWAWPDDAIIACRKQDG